MIKAVAFDCFGVLVSETWLAFKREHFGQGTEAFERASQLMDQAYASVISHEEFLEQVAKMSGLSVGQVQKALGGHVANDELFNYIASDLKPKYKIGLLSNAAANWLEEFFTKDQLALIDAISLSFESGIIKPDPRAFEAMADQLGVQVNEMVFVDDQERLLIPAKSLGLKTVLYQNFEQTKRELGQILGA